VTVKDPEKCNRKLSTGQTSWWCAAFSRPAERTDASVTVHIAIYSLLMRKYPNHQAVITIAQSAIAET
jgi:hypothetical protein